MAVSDFTPNLELPYLLSNQAQKHVTLNESLRALDGLLQLSVQDRDLAAPPSDPQEGRRYLIASDATGDWTGHSGEIVLYSDAEWLFFAPLTGWRVWVEDEALLLIFDGMEWISATPKALQDLTHIGLGATADEANPLLARLNATLFTAQDVSSGGSGDLRFKLNKEVSGNVLSLLFQTGYGSRAEVGLVGDDDFVIRTSSDGSIFTEALRLSQTDGMAEFPAGLAYDNALSGRLEATTVQGALDELALIPAARRQYIRDRIGLSSQNVVLRNHVTGEDWLSSTSGANNNWYALCWAAELGLFCAVAATGTGNRVMTSADGINWTAQTSASDNSWRTICWSPELGLFCALANSGTGDRVMTSPDGVNWTSRTSASDNNWLGVCWSSDLGLFCGVAGSGSGDRVMTSPDGINWTSRTSAADNSWRSVCWSAELGLFCAVAATGSGDGVMASPDGIVWTTRVSASDESWLSVCWAPELGLFCAVATSGTGNRVMTSPDGVTWTARTSAADNEWSSVSWSPELGVFCAVSATGSSDRVMTSADGVTWTLGVSASDRNWWGVSWSPELGLFAAVATNGSGDRAMTSVSSHSYTYRS